MIQSLAALGWVLSTHEAPDIRENVLSNKIYTWRSISVLHKHMGWQYLHCFPLETIWTEYANIHVCTAQ